ncbi:MAG TPA: TetR family transcriptional regulator [Mycobacterium sp.]|nr:TetR family transcriptional regulator [Mycobacterium sp.]
MRVRTHAAILTATASALAADRLATLPDIAASAGVSRTTLHRYFADRETLVYEATLDSIRILAETVDEAVLEHGPTAEALRRLIAALLSIADRVLFLFADRATLQNTPAELNEDFLICLIERGQHDGTFDPDLDATWIRHALYGLVLQGCADAISGELPRHTPGEIVFRTLEGGARPISKRR